MINEQIDNRKTDIGLMIIAGHEATLGVGLPYSDLKTHSLSNDHKYLCNLSDPE